MCVFICVKEREGRERETEREGGRKRERQGGRENEIASLHVHCHLDEEW